ncbi:hypothetical protein QAD02_010466 [Eretmocerus hayati]|uniref:Uncharacterized protein n=1 Tax=Eretmocerus hayati TaxID=131215 RepID=A0ACC2NTW1_9HYME|nr:hypothetical protein QAD02_010466 [Eretmocerus hayati]
MFPRNSQALRYELANTPKNFFEEVEKLGINVYWVCIRIFQPRNKLKPFKNVTEVVESRCGFVPKQNSLENSLVQPIHKKVFDKTPQNHWKVLPAKRHLIFPITRNSLIVLELFLFEIQNQ